MIRFLSERLKRNIKYDEEKLSLQMSVWLSNKLEWLTVNPSMAKEESSKIDSSEKEATLAKLSTPEQPAPTSNLRQTNPTTTQEFSCRMKRAGLLPGYFLHKQTGMIPLTNMK